MKKLFWIIGLACILFGEFGYAGPNGAGIILGSPTGITGKFWMDGRVAYDAGISFSTGDYILVYGDYLYHYPGSFKGNNQFLMNVTPYLGIGGVFALTTADRSNNDRIYGKRSGAFGLGIRVPFGAEWRPGKPPLGIFLELAPGISVAPATDILIMGGLGIRYYF